MLIVDKNCIASSGGHKVNFSAFNCKFTVQRGGRIDLSKAEKIDKNKPMADASVVTAELLSRTQYVLLQTKEVKPKADPPKKEEKKVDPEKKEKQPKADPKSKDPKKSEK